MGRMSKLHGLLARIMEAHGSHLSAEEAWHHIAPSVDAWFSSSDTHIGGVYLIAEERQRQIDEEGWTPEHDDEHVDGEMASAAMCYACPPDLDLRCVVDEDGHPASPIEWPWSPAWYKPTPDDRIRELVKAGALIAAEIDRLQRQEAEAPPVHLVKFHEPAAWCGVQDPPAEQQTRSLLFMTCEDCRRVVQIHLDKHDPELQR